MLISLKWWDLVQKCTERLLRISMFASDWYSCESLHLLTLCFYLERIKGHKMQANGVKPFKFEMWMYNFFLEFQVRCTKITMKTHCTSQVVYIVNIIKCRKFCLEKSSQEHWWLMLELAILVYEKWCPQRYPLLYKSTWIGG